MGIAAVSDKMIIIELCFKKGLFCSQEVALKQTRSCPHRGPMEIKPVVIGTYGRYRYGCDQILALSTNNSWKSVRSAVQPMFGANSLSRYVPRLLEHAGQATMSMLEAGKSGQEVDVHSVLGCFTFRNILFVSMGIDAGPDYNKASENGSTGSYSSQVTRVAREFDKCVRYMIDFPIFDIAATKLAMLLPVWMQRYAAMIAFNLAALVPGSLEQQLKAKREYGFNLALSLVNKERLAKGLPVKYPLAKDFGLQAADGSLISLLASSKN